jgi:hypothetical protein
MSLNKLLCKYLDKDGRGYVRIGSLAPALVASGIVVSAIIFYARGATITYERYTSMQSIGEMCSMFDEIAIPFFIIGTLFAICVVMLMILNIMVIGLCYVLDTKIATCERRDGDK